MTERNRRKDPYYPPIEVAYNIAGPSAYPELPSHLVNFVREIRGQRVLEIAAGDGRATALLLEGNNAVVVSDINEEALRSLRSRMPQELQQKLSLVVFDATGTATSVASVSMPLSDSSFDAVVSINFLYVYPPEILEKELYPEIRRVLTPGGFVFFDLISDAKREKPTGELVPFKVNYTLQSGMETARRLEHYGFRVETTVFPLDQPPSERVDYRLTGKSILVKARKV